jgi:hypothetical protein
LLVGKYFDPHSSDSYRVDTLEQTETHQAPNSCGLCPRHGFQSHAPPEHTRGV